MSYITIDNINSINAELSNYCNAACPMCARYFLDGVLNKDKVNNSHTTLEFLKKKIPISVINNLKNFTSCGNLGDATMNPECLEIYSYIKDNSKNVWCSLNTNGGARNKDFWKELAHLKVRVIFAIDGLKDTNHLYRRNVVWQKLIDNVESFISAGGIASWAMLVFQHNQHQIEECKEMSKKMNFKNFYYQQSARWADFDSNGNWLDLNEISLDNYKIKKFKELTSLKIGSGANSQKQNLMKDDFKNKKITCQSFDKRNEIYLAANGDVSPCCWLGDLKEHESKNIIENYKSVNLNYTDLKDILKGDYFKKLWEGIQGLPNSKRLHTCYFHCGIN
jgi:MoaA/NifB/PqqE/SkfB family radical SAM enzyme